MNFQHIFTVLALILAIATTQIEAKKGGKRNNPYVRAGAHVAGKAVEGMGGAIAAKIFEGK